MWAIFINATHHCQSYQTWEKGKTNIMCPQPQSNGRTPTTSQHLQWVKTKIPTVSEPFWSSMIKVVGPLLTFLSNRPAIYFNSKSPKFLNIWQTWIHFLFIIHIMWHVWHCPSTNSQTTTFSKKLVTNSPQISEDPLPNLDLPKRSPEKHHESVNKAWPEYRPLSHDALNPLDNVIFIWCLTWINIYIYINIFTHIQST